jgi:hypothetical protein
LSADFSTREPDFDLTVTLADIQTGSILCGRAVEDVSIIKCEFRPVPRTHDRTVVEGALGQRSFHVRARMRERADTTALAHEQNVGVVVPGVLHGIVWDFCRLRDCGKGIGLGDGCVRDTNLLAEPTSPPNHAAPIAMPYPANAHA